VAIKILTRLMDHVAKQRAQWGSVWDGPVMLTPKEHEALKTEIGSGGAAQIMSIEGVKILVGSVSDLPAPLPSEPETALMKKWTEKPLFVPKPLLLGKGGAEVPKITTMAKPPTPVKVYHQSGSDEHATPQALFDKLHEEFHFDLDVCATAPYEVPNPDVPDSPVEPYTLLHPGNAKCPVYFTKDDDGLKQHWFGRVWMNPPYTHGQIAVWIQKLLKELIAGRIDLGVALTAARPDTAWFQVVASYAAEIRFLKGRLTFEGQPNAAPFPSAILIFDPTRTAQSVRFWDWQTGTAPVYWKAKGYLFTPGKPGHPGLAIKAPSTLALVK